MAAAVLLVAVVIGSILLFHNPRTTQSGTTVPYQKWCKVAGDPAIVGVNKVIALAPDNAWAIGGPEFGLTSVFEHWDGSHWKMINSAAITSAGDQAPAKNLSGTLEDMVAISANNIWAVGFTYSLNSQNRPLGAYYTLVEHWDGTQWKQIASVNTNKTPSPWNSLDVIAASSANDIWAAGYTDGTIPYGAGNLASVSTLLEHWDGHAWSRVVLPAALGKGLQPGSLAVGAPDDVWLSGNVVDAQGQVQNSRCLHWDGRSWSQVQLPAQFNSQASPITGWFINGVVATSANNVWAFGGTRDARHPESVPLVMHWDGNHWTRFSVPLKEQRSFLTGAASAAGPDNLWISGAVDSSNRRIHPFLEYWDGSGWQQIALPIRGSDYVNDVAVAGNKVWLLHAIITSYSNSSYIETNC